MIMIRALAWLSGWDSISQHAERGVGPMIAGCGRGGILIDQA